MGALGGGLGYLAPDDPKLRARSALVGAGTGAVLGGLGGAMASGGLGAGEVSQVQEKSFNLGRVVGNKAGLDQGFTAGQESILKNLPDEVMTLLHKLKGAP